MDPQQRAIVLRQIAQHIGLGHVSFTAAEMIRRYDLYAAWLAADRAGEMVYLHRDAALRRDPRQLLRDARTIVCTALVYAQGQGGEGGGHPAPAAAEGSGGLRGQIARYARGEDYHLVLKRRLQELALRFSERLDRPLAYRICVDSAPLLEREVAVHAGLGFLAKNTLLITPGIGSYTVLGELLLDVEVAPGEALAPRCGACTLCLSACPTGALVSAYQLDARRCISYLTIELQGPIPIDLRPLMGTWIFGCDLCQEVCPWNAAGRDRPGDPGLAPRRHLLAPELVPLLRIGAAQFRRFVKRTALRRIHRAQLLRNVAVALGNAGTAAEVPPLIDALAEPAALVRRHVAWALGRIGQRDPAAAAAARAGLRAARDREADPEVQQEIAAALADL